MSQLQPSQMQLTRDELALIHNIFKDTQWKPDAARACAIAASIIGKTAALVSAYDQSTAQPLPGKDDEPCQTAE